MSVSPPIRRLSTSSKREEELINAYEAEEERIINLLSRKLEKLREEKIELENALEAESESHVNRLSRELTVLRLAQQQQQQQQNGTIANGSVSASPDARTGPGWNAFWTGSTAPPSAETMLDAMKRENEQLRSRLVDTERNYIRVVRLNDIYREELIDLRRRLGLPVDNLIGLPTPNDPYSQPTHRRSFSNMSAAGTQAQPPSRPVGGVPINGVPIPRPSSRIYRPSNPLSEATTPVSSSSDSHPPSPFPFSPVTSPMLTSLGNPASLMSNGTVLTTPASSASLHNTPPGANSATPARILSYPSVPPPSLSSSFGSPQTPFHFPPSRDQSASPVERRGIPLPRRGSAEWRVAESGNLRRSASRGGMSSGSQSRRESVERGARVAETGSLARNRSRHGSIGSAMEVGPLPEESEGKEDGPE